MRDDFDVIDLINIDYDIFDEINNINDDVINVWFNIIDEIDVNEKIDVKNDEINTNVIICCENDEFNISWFDIFNNIIEIWFNIIDDVDALCDDNEINWKLI